MKSAQSRKSLGAAMVIFSLLIVALSITYLVYGAIEVMALITESDSFFSYFFLTLQSPMWLVWFSFELLIISCYILVDGKAALAGNAVASAKNKKSSGIAALIFSLLLLSVSASGVRYAVLSGLGFVFGALMPIIQLCGSIMIFAYSIHLIVAGNSILANISRASVPARSPYVPRGTSYAASEETVYELPAQAVYAKPEGESKPLEAPSQPAQEVPLPPRPERKAEYTSSDSDRVDYSDPDYPQPPYSQPLYEQPSYRPSSYEPPEPPAPKDPLTPKTLICPNCGEKIVAYPDLYSLTCSCGKKYKNPYYKG